MNSASSHPVRVETALPRTIAAVRARLPIAEVPRRFAMYLDQVYAAGRSGTVRLDGQNVFLYQPTDAAGIAEIEFGVGAAAPFAPVGSVRSVSLPTGDVAATTHWGDYAGLGAAHAAVLTWIREQGQQPTGLRWEVYGHWSEDPAGRRTDVYYLVGGERSA